MMRGKWVWAILMGVSLPIYADSGFMPEPGFTFPGAWTGQPITAVFENPAKLSRSVVREKQAVAADTAQNYFGYSRYSLAYLGYTDDFSWGVGATLFGANDYIRSDRNRTTSRIEGVGSFGQGINTYSLAVATPFSDHFVFGAALDYTVQYIDNVSASQLGIGFGMNRSITRNWGIAVSWRRLFQTGFSWSDKVQQARSTPVATLEFRSDAKDGYAAFSAGVGLAKLYAEQSLTEELRVVGDVSSDNGAARYSAGTVIRLGEVSIQYLHVGYLGDFLQADQEFFGVMYEFK
ncbi:hypothetical protein EBR96_01625 [bacterium]|nr:hypothetical protein [bacterium]